jgi:malate dehydrogenase
MLRGRIQNGGYPWPCGVYFGAGPFQKVMMAADVDFTPDGIVGREPQGASDDMAALKDSYQHLCKLRDEIIQAGLLPPVNEWPAVNPNL